LSRFRPDWTSGIRASQTPNTTGWIKNIPITWRVGFQEIDLIMWISGLFYKNCGSAGFGKLKM
jgi:hypothetical protein